MEIINGTEIAEGILLKLKNEIENIKFIRQPKIVFIRVGNDTASVIYVNRKKKVAESIGICSEILLYDESTNESKVIEKIRELNKDSKVDGILVQSPLPAHIDAQKIFNEIHPLKDVDGFHVANLGGLAQEYGDYFVPCTPLGIIELLKASGVRPSGKHVVIVGRSLIVGKPLSLLLSSKHEFGNATVTMCHSYTRGLKDICLSGDILISAMGKAEFIRGDMIKEGGVVIDVGINRIECTKSVKGYKIVGDIFFDEASKRASKITPVPGGVGPMTVAMLMVNTVKAFKLNNSKF